MARDTKAQRIARFYAGMAKMGFTYDEANTLRRAQMTLHRWSEEECNGTIQRDEVTGKTYRVWDTGRKMAQTPCPDRETGAIKRIKAIMAKHYHLTFYHQTDPRGCALYVIHKADIPADTLLDACYNRGFGVCY